jgi:hypothetical protein
MWKAQEHHKYLLYEKNTFSSIWIFTLSIPIQVIRFNVIYFCHLHFEKLCHGWENCFMEVIFTEFMFDFLRLFIITSCPSFLLLVEMAFDGSGEIERETIIWIIL